MTKLRYDVSLLALPVMGLLLSACGGGGGGGGGSSTKPTNPNGLHEPVPSNSAVVVGVADTGFRITHETIAPYLLKAINLTDSSSDVSGDEDHGTAIASLVTRAPSRTGLLLAKVSEDDKPGIARSDILDYSVGYLANEGARVINHSWNGRINAPDPRSSYLGVNSLTSLKAITTSNDGLGSVYVVSAGNGGKPLQSENPIHQYDELFKRLLIVGGSILDANDELDLHPQSNHPGDDAKWQSRFLTAPWSVSAASADGDDTYASWEGTSFSAPQVAELAAAIIERWPHLDAVRVSQHLIDTADKSSPLYQSNTCGENGNTNCGSYYLGEGEADIFKALEPAGTLAFPTGSEVGGASVDAHESVATLSNAYGDSLTGSAALENVAAFDDLGRDYLIDLSDYSQARHDREQAMLNHMERLSVASPQQRQQFDGTHKGFTFSSVSDGYGEILSSRLDGRMGNTQWTAFHFAGNEVDPLSAYGQSKIMPMLSYQGGSALTEGLDAVSGLRTAYPQGENFTIIAKHWAGERHEDTAAHASDYQAQRSDIGLRMALTKGIGLTSTVGVLEENQGLLGAQGSGVLSIGNRNRTTFSGVTLDASLGNKLSAFANYEQGRGDAQGSSLIKRINDIRVGEFGMGLQWSGDRHLAALGYRQPMRIDSAIATLSVPIGRTTEGAVIRESREMSLSPSGRQQDIELGYTFLPSELSALQFNIVYTLEPGHDGEASPDTAAMVNYHVRF